MRFYTAQHQFYGGIDLHARTMYVCVLNQAGEVLVHRNLKAEPEMFLKTIARYREKLVVCVACLFTRYWLADLCVQEGIPCILGHALYMKAIHGGKAKHNDANVFYRLRSIPGVGKILALVLLYEIHDLQRFPRLREFVSYCRLMTCAEESASPHGEGRA